MWNPMMAARISAAALVLFAAACGTTASPAAAPTSAPATGSGSSSANAAAPGCPADPAAARADQNLRAMVSHGSALPDHVGPDVAREMFADLDRDAARYLARFECAFVSPAPAAGFESLLLATTLWHLRKHDGARVQQLAARVVFRYEELARTPPDPAADPYFAQRVRERIATMSFIRDGLDVAAGPRWIGVPAAGYQSCTTATPDGHAAIRVTRECSCGEALSCAATPDARGALALVVKYDPDSPAMCSDCYATHTACTVPAGASPASLPARCVP
jgi:hypothetical protein